jgi:alkanesulfonate monooxygenase SsuD/methylene tetrahydromethanopterin reductase-like flavin-dependent oxidoreductase (luciferase family)
MPADVALPPIHLLGSSGYSAELAAVIGAGFAFALRDPRCRRSHDELPPRFRPSAALAHPHAILGVAAVCADTQAAADRLATTIDLNFLRRSKGEYLPLASPEEADAYPYTAADRERIRHNRARVFTGTVDTVRARLDPLLAATKADEVMVTTMIYDRAR